MGRSPVINFILVTLLFGVSAGAADQAPVPVEWKRHMQVRINELDAQYPGQFGIFVQDLQTGTDFSYRGGENWYLASGVKLAVAIEVFRQIEKGKLTLETKIKIGSDDLIDGPGQLHTAETGSAHTVLFLLEQMLIHSDNTASDLLIRKVGIENVNALVKPLGFNPITTLGEVRRHIYGYLHPKARKLTNADFIKLGRAGSDMERALLLETLLEVPPTEWKRKSVEQGYISYYASGMNSASLKAITQLLNQAIKGQLLKPASTEVLLGIMSRVETGEKRMKSGMPSDLTVASKTGTQRKRVCEFAVIRRGSENLALVSACTRGIARKSDSEKLLAELGRTLSKSGIFKNGTSLANGVHGE